MLLFLKGLRTGKMQPIAFVDTSKCHLESLQVIVEFPKGVADIGELLSSVHAHNKAFNRNCFFLKILQNIQFLGRQGIALRVHFEEESNFIQLCKLRAHDSNGMSR